MFCLMNRLFNKRKKKVLANKPNGQVALILVIIIAMSLIFFAVALNLGKLAQYKTTTIIAANTSAAAMASFLASYAENLYQTQLGGEDECDGDLTVGRWTGLASAVMTIVAIVIAIVSAGSMAPLSAALIAIAIVIALASVVLQAVVVQPAVQSLVDRMFEAIRAPAENFRERGLYTALTQAVTDQSLRADVYDMDMDSILAPNDKVNRFAYFYVNKRAQIRSTPSVSAYTMARFMQALGSFVYEPYYELWKGNKDILDHPGIYSNNWALWEPFDCRENSASICCSPPPLGECFAGIDCNDPNNARCCVGTNSSFCTHIYPTYCNSNLCCLAPDDPLFANEYAECNPICRDAFAVEPGTNPDVDAHCATGCNDKRYALFDPYYDYDGDNAAALTTTGLLTFSQNNYQTGPFISFKEWLGRDDPNLKCRVDASNPRLQEDDPQGGNLTGTDLYDYSKGIFRNTDATGIFPALWKLGYMTDLTQFQATSITNENKLEMCYWCDVDYPPCADYADTTNRPNLPDCTPSSHSFDDCCVNKNDNLDIVWNITDIAMEEGQCPEEPGHKIWKKGEDGYCSFGPMPYDEQCPYIDCPGYLSSCDGEPPYSCVYDSSDNDDNTTFGDTTTSSSNWHRDSLDNMRRRMPEFIEWANGILRQDLRYLGRSLVDWAPDLVKWLNSKKAISTLTGGTISPGDKNAEDGIVTKWRNELDGLKTSLDKWRNGDKFVTTNNAQIRCEYVYWDPTAGQPYPKRTIQDIINCLDNERGLESDPNVKAKIGYRLLYLMNLAQNTPPNIVNQLIDDLETTIIHFDALLEKAQEVISEWVKFREGKQEAVLTPSVIYGWKDDEKQGGSWHVVYVETKLPTLCGGQCERRGKNNQWLNPQNPEPSLPYLKSYTRHAGMRRYYSLGDSFDQTKWCDDDSPGHREYDNASGCFRGGTTKARVIRWDQNQDWVSFANKLKIWRFIYERPGGTLTPGDMDNAFQHKCTVGGPNQDKAFLLNKASDDPECWDFVRGLLLRGVKTDACAEYYWNNLKKHFSVKFVRCEGAW